MGKSTITFTKLQLKGEDVLKEIATGIPNLKGECHPLTLPWPSGKKAGYGHDLRVSGHKLGEPTVFLVSSDPQWGWYCWAYNEKDKKFYGMTTHVKNSLLVEYPWLSELLGRLLG